MEWFLGIAAVVVVAAAVFFIVRRPRPGPSLPAGRTPPAAPASQAAPPRVRGPAFPDLVRADSLRNAIADMGWPGPSGAQAEIIPRVREHLDVVAAAPAGAGKTTGALIAAIEQQVDREGLHTLVLCPDRAAVERATTAAKALTSDTDLWVGALHDDVPMQSQLRDLRAGYDLVVGTPGRVQEHLAAGNLSLDAIEVVVLDEADRMGGPVRQPMESVLQALPTGRQTILLARDAGDGVRDLAQRFARDPAWVYASAGAPSGQPKARGGAAPAPGSEKKTEEHPRRGGGDRPVRSPGATGSVRWFNNSKGYGFITPDASEEDIFVHYTAIREEGFKSLDEGERVRFDIVDTKKGPEADNVTKL